MPASDKSTEPMTPAPKVHLVTFGCQMNKYDSELLGERMRVKGYESTDVAGNANIALNRTFTVNGATAGLTNPPAGQIVGTGVINGRHYLEVTFRPSSGHAINPATINGGEIVFKDPADHEKAIRYAMACQDIDAAVIGFTSTQQIDEAIERINRALAEV